jgi:hypothetical protein
MRCIFFDSYLRIGKYLEWQELTYFFAGIMHTVPSSISPMHFEIWKYLFWLTFPKFFSYMYLSIWCRCSFSLSRHLNKGIFDWGTIFYPFLTTSLRTCPPAKVSWITYNRKGKLLNKINNNFNKAEICRNDSRGRVARKVRGGRKSTGRRLGNKSNRHG